MERLAETGEETVLLTASTSDLCVGHLASSKALRFVNTADIGVVKNKFLNFLTGTHSTLHLVVVFHICLLLRSGLVLDTRLYIPEECEDL